MGVCKEEAVRFVKIDDESIVQIKKMLDEKTDINFKDSKKGLKPPVIVLALDPDGKINVVTSDQEFNLRYSLSELLQRISNFTAIISATIFAGKGSEIASVNIGGENLTDEYPPL